MEDIRSQQDMTDEELAGAVKNGDSEAFRELMTRYASAIGHFSRQYAKAQEDVDDIVQDSFFKAWKHIKRFKTGKAWRPWLYAIARNTALDYIKKRRASAFSELDDKENDIAFADSLEDDAPLQPEIFDRVELRTALEASMESLHPDHKAVLVMHYKEEMTFDEIADVIGKPMNTVKSWHRRALIKLKPKLMHRA